MIKLSSEKLVPVAIMVISLGLSLPWLYLRGAGEPDSNAMLVGIYQGVLQGTWFGGNLYMLQGQPLYYAVGFVIQRLFRFSFDHLALAMNLLAALLSAGTAVLLYRILRSFAGSAVALGVTLMTLSSATIFEWSTYTHPVTLSHFLFFASQLALLTATARASTPGGRAIRTVVWYCAAVALGAAAVAARADIVVLFHLYLLLPLLWLLYGRTDTRIGGRQDRMLLFSGIIVGLLAVCGGLLALTAFSAGGAAGEETAAVAGLLQTFLKYFRLISPIDGLFETVFGFGVAGSLLFLAVLVRCIVGRKWLSIALALALVLPPVFYAMSNVQPARRWFPVIYAMAIALTVLCTHMRARPMRRFIAAYGVLAIAINLYLLPAAGHALRRAGVSVDDHTLLYRATADVFRHHTINQHYLARAFPQMWKVRKAPPGSLLVGSFADVYFLMATYCKDGLPATATVLDEANGYFMTQVTGDESVYYIAEVRSPEQAPPLEINPPFIFQLKQPMPPSWQSEAATIISLVPARAERYAMWLRRP